jgi:hypothetical protein
MALSRGRMMQRGAIQLVSKLGFALLPVSVVFRLATCRQSPL